MGIKFFKTPLKDVYEIDYYTHIDTRGFFTKIYSKDKLENITNFSIKQVNVSTSIKKGTFRGLHYQVGKYSEKKIVFCLQGQIRDFIVNINKKSKDYLKTFSLDICSEKKNGILIPSSYAHGFLTMKKNTSVIYLHDREYNNASERGVRYNDPLINLKFPINLTNISKKDKNYPNLSKNKNIL